MHNLTTFFLVRGHVVGGEAGRAIQYATRVHHLGRRAQAARILCPELSGPVPGNVHYLTDVVGSLLDGGEVVAEQEARVEDAELGGLEAAAGRLSM